MPANCTTFLALCVLQQAIDASKRGKVPPSIALRLALAYLYDVGVQAGTWHDREPYDEFWTAATQEDQHGDNAAGFGRSQMLNAHLNAIARAAGMEMDVTLYQRVLEAVRAGVDAETPRSEPRGV